MDALLSTGLIKVQTNPTNAETELRVLDSAVTPTESFYIRSNFHVPDIDATKWNLCVTAVDGARRFISMQELHAAAATEVTVTVECAGNGRTLMNPVPGGTPWTLGAVGTARFKGVTLRSLLGEVATDAAEVLFRGSDSGEVSAGRRIEFERSLPIHEALRDDVLVAYEMNGAPLTAEHGYPARLVVPGYYGVAWVKWLDSIEVIRQPFAGHFQAERYIYRDDPSEAPDAPVTRMRVRALITSPDTGAAVPVGPIDVRGIAWSGFGPVVSVDVSADNGSTWIPAKIDEAFEPAERYAAVSWRASLDKPASGRMVIVARATDEAGNTQPLEPIYNELGYGNNVVHRVVVTVES